MKVQSFSRPSFNTYLFVCPGSSLPYVGSSSLNRDEPRTPALGVWSLSHWTTREVPRPPF